MYEVKLLLNRNCLVTSTVALIGSLFLVLKAKSYIFFTQINNLITSYINPVLNFTLERDLTRDIPKMVIFPNFKYKNFIKAKQCIQFYIGRY